MCDRYRHNIVGLEVCIETSDYLCTTCSYFEYNEMIKKQGYDDVNMKVIRSNSPNTEFLGGYNNNANDDGSDEEQEQEESDTSTEDSIDFEYSRFE